MAQARYLPTTKEGCMSHLLEEFGEVMQTIGKIQRFGEVVHDPSTNITYDNVNKLKSELDDVKLAVSRLERWLYPERTLG